MIDRYRRQLRFWRGAGIDIFVIPGPGAVSGMAYCTPQNESPTGKTRLHINISGSVHSRLWLFVLLHEVAHHALGHTSRFTTQPTWSQEYQTDQYALALLRDHQPAAVALAEEESKRHIRPLLQGMIDYGITHHVDLDIARWAGCEIPEEMEERLTEMAETFKRYERGDMTPEERAREEEIPF